MHLVYLEWVNGCRLLPQLHFAVPRILLPGEGLSTITQGVGWSRFRPGILFDLRPCRVLEDHEDRHRFQQSARCVHFR